MRSPEDELIIVLSHGMDGWMLGTTTDAVEIATFVNTTGNQAVPKTAEAIEGLLWDMLHHGLVDHQSMPLNMERGIELHRAYALTEEGWARARELEAADSPRADDP